MELLRQLASRDGLLASGVVLVMAGVLLKGFARSSRRNLARRKQHRLDERKSDDAELNRQLDRPPGWWEQHVGSVANIVLIAGIVIAIASFWRR